MQQTYSTKLSFLFFLLLGASLASAQTYVNHDATGNNDGTTWGNAYTNLNTALENTNSGAIWIAAGTYIPTDDMPDSTTTFAIHNDVDLYGGFAGTEASLEDRDLENNITILSADINGDDIDDDFSMNRDDNVQHVIYVDSLISSTVIIDGLTIQGGNTADNGDLNEVFRSGGGIFSYSTLDVRNCNFNNNFGRAGAGIAISSFGGGGSGSSFTNCKFEHNATSSQSAGIFVASLSDITLENCEFIENTTVRGAFYPLTCTNVNINNCLFENNEALTLDGFGGAMFNWQSTGITVTNTTFRGNTAGNGAVMYHDGREADINSTNLVFNNCVFEENQATGWGGGGLYVWRGSFEIHNSSFVNNQAPNTGAHFFSGGDDKDVIIRDCTFDGGTAGWGAGHACYGLNSNYTLVNNEYINGVAQTSGGAIINGFLANVTIDSCSFNDNSAQFGGAIYNQNDTTTVSISNSSFIGNECTGSGGAINLAGGIYGTIDNCLFEGNSADFGGGVSASASDSPNRPVFSLSNSIFNFNLAETQAGGLNLNDIDAEITNTVFANNLNSGGYGGAISNNASDSTTTEVSIINSTFTDNIAVNGAGIAQWTGEIDAATTMTLQNCIFNNPDGENYAVEAGTPELVSNGGNLVNSDDMTDLLTHMMDVHEADPMFVDADNFDYHLLAMSPAINAGVSEGAPEFDIEGNPREGNVDIGAYEFQSDVSTTEVVKNDGQLNTYPNPFKDQLTFELDNDWTGSLQIQLNNVIGQNILSWPQDKTTDVFKLNVELPELQAGTYHLIITNGNQIISTKLTKI